MKQMLVEIDDQTATALERIAPARSRKRSDFIRHALRRALWEQEEQATRAAYLRTPDVGVSVYTEPKAWEPAPETRVGRRKKR